MSAFAFVPPRALGAAPVPADWRFVVAASQVASRKTEDARGPYNTLSAGVSRLLDIWNKEGAPRAVSLAAALSSAPTAAARLRDLADRAATAEMPADWLRDRLEHFIREDARAWDALQAFIQADARRLGDLSAASQRDAETLLRNQVPETSALAALSPHARRVRRLQFWRGLRGLSVGTGAGRRCHGVRGTLESGGVRHAARPGGPGTIRDVMPYCPTVSGQPASNPPWKHSSKI